MIKKISILLQVILCCLSGMSQNLPVSDVAHIKFPSGTLTFTDEREQTFKASKTDLYKSDNVIIFINAGHENLTTHHLTDMKKGDDYLFTQFSPEYATNYTSDIKTINNNQVLIIFYIRENKGYYNVSFANPTFTAMLGIHLEFNPSDKEKATAMLNRMLNSVRFKN